MSYILSDLVTRVQQRVRDTGYSSTEIISYINDTQNDVFNKYQLSFMETTQTYTLSSGASDITNGSGLPANYVQAINLIGTTDGWEGVIPYKDTVTSDSTNPDQDDQPSNYPQYWYKFGSTIRVYPRPHTSLDVTLRYYKKPTELSAGGNVPEIPSEFAELLVAGAAYRVLQVKDNYDQADIHQNKYDELLQKLVVKYSQVQTGQVFIMPTNTYTRVGNF